MDVSDVMAICDVFHLRCFKTRSGSLRPSRSTVASGQWFCPACEAYFLREDNARVKELSTNMSPLSSICLRIPLGAASYDLIRCLEPKEVAEI